MSIDGSGGSRQGAGRTALSSGVVKRAVVDARAEAKRIVEEAEAEAAAVRQGLDRLARETREVAYREGYEDGLFRLYDMLLDARERRDAAFAAAEQDLLRLAVKIAEKIIGHQIEVEPATLADIVSAALRHARQSEALTVYVNPADLPTLQEFRATLDPGGRARFLDIVPNPEVGRGGCVIKSESGTVDAQLDTQLRVLERDLLAHKAGERH